jgi:hypothetical protein
MNKKLHHFEIVRRIGFDRDEWLPTTSGEPRKQGTKQKRRAKRPAVSISRAFVPAL